MTKKFNNHTGPDIVSTLLGGVFLLSGFAFFMLKLFQVVNWPWWLVFLPWWGPIALLVVLLIISIIIVMLTPSKE